MSVPTLTYFDTSGRGEPLRMVFAAAGIDFKDERISFQEFGQRLGDFPMGAVPVIDIDGITYTQSNSLLRYYGKQAGLYPADAWEAYKCDEIMGAIEDMTHKMVESFGLEGDALKAARAKFVAGPVTNFVKLLEQRLAAGGDYVADNQLTVGDLKVMVMLSAFNTGWLDHMPTDTVSRISPAVQSYVERVTEHPVVKSYYAARA